MKSGDEVKHGEDRYVLTLTPEQARVTRDALELYARLRIGQFNRITELMLEVRNVDDYCARRDVADDLLKVVANIIFGRNQYGQPNALKDKLHHRAWNIYHMIRYKMAWHENPKGGFGCHYDKPYPSGGEPVPECEIITVKKNGGKKHEAE